MQEELQRAYDAVEQLRERMDKSMRAVSERARLPSRVDGARAAVVSAFEVGYTLAEVALHDLAQRQRVRRASPAPDGPLLTRSHSALQHYRNWWSTRRWLLESQSCGFRRTPYVLRCRCVTENTTLMPALGIYSRGRTVIARESGGRSDGSVAAGSRRSSASAPRV